MPRDKRTLKKSHSAKLNRQKALRFLEAHGEPAKEYNRATAHLSRAKRRAEAARQVLTEGCAKKKNNSGPSAGQPANRDAESTQIGTTRGGAL